MDVHPRYRVEHDEHCVDVRLTGPEQMFDNRDPAPFGVRDLDPDLVDYLLGAAEDLAPRGPFRIICWFPAVPDVDIAHAVRAHLHDQLAVITRRRRRQRRTGQLSLLIGSAALIVMQALAEVVLRFPSSHVRDAVREGLVILSWVALWRPVDLLIYEWIPFRRQRRLLRRLHGAPIDVRAGQP